MRFFYFFGLIFVWFCQSEVFVVEVKEEQGIQEVQTLKKVQQEEGSFLLAFAPFSEPEKIKKMYGNFADYLSQKLNVKVRIVVAEDYETLLENLRTGIFQAAFLSPVNYAKLVQNKPLGISYCVSAEIRGKSEYYGLIISHASQGISRISQLRNKDFGFVDRNSASGFVFPYYRLLELGLNPERDFRRIYFLGSHGRILEAIRTGRIAGGATYDGRLEELGEEEKKHIVILAKTSPIPYDTVVLSKTGRSYLESLRQILLAVSPQTKLEDGRLVLDPSTGIGITGFRVKEQDFVQKIALMVQKTKL